MKDWAGYRKKKMQEFIDYKKTLKCLDCGTNDYRVLQFHHRDKDSVHRLPSGKRVKIATWVQTGNVTKWKEYVTQCDVLCSNCHIIRHYEDENETETADRPGTSTENSAT